IENSRIPDTCRTDPPISSRNKPQPNPNREQGAAQMYFSSLTIVIALRRSTQSGTKHGYAHVYIEDILFNNLEQDARKLSGLSFALLN
ncbi:MAG: hypothetical protein DYH16_08860, partial [Nitrosomonas sp. PRO5]|nr:hypothetical protein [Nitrosomonas sp. PRO5]